MKIENFREKLIESMFGNVLMFVLNLILPLMISRIYGVETYGSYVYGITVVNIAMLLANLGMDTSLIYFIPRTGNKYVKSSFVINLLTSGLAILIILIFMPAKVTPYLGLVWLMSAEQLFFSLYRSRHKIRDFFIIKSFIGLIGTMALSGLFYYTIGSDVTSIILATYLSVILSIILYFFQNRHMFEAFNLKMEFISYSLTIIMGGVLSVVIAYIDIVMIEAMMTKTDVGLYKVGTELAQFPSLFLRIVNTVFPPLIAKLYHEGKIEEVRHLYEKVTRGLFLVSALIISTVFLFHKQILGLYGPEYLSADKVLIYRGIGQLFNACVGSVWYIIIMTGHPRIRFFGVLVSAAINVVLNYLLIPTMGIDGAALASMISTIFINILGFLIVKKILNSKVYYIV